jgi:glyoxylase-like metal-dependent hydrolase (beta-lactamase superfamily II)
LSTGSGENDERHAWLAPGVFEVAPGVHRVPLPLPNDGLRAVNVYVLQDGDQLVLIDSGWALEEARDQLESALGELGYGFADIRRFLVTHVHRDHYTLGVKVRREFGVPVSLGRNEHPTLETVMSGSSDRQLAHLQLCGADELVAELRPLAEGPDPQVEQYELPDQWLEPGEIKLTDRTLRAIATPGHTRGHLVFLDEEAGIMFTGDHVLPHITPSIGLEAARAQLPLGDFLDSLQLLLTYPDVRMLPAHGPVVDSVHKRVRELLNHHDQRLAVTADAVTGGASTAYEVARQLGWTRRQRALDELDLFNKTLAVGETAAHLDVLVERGSLVSSVVDGVARYSLP